MWGFVFVVLGWYNIVLCGSRSCHESCLAVCCSWLVDGEGVWKVGGEASVIREGGRRGRGLYGFFGGAVDAGVDVSVLDELATLDCRLHLGLGAEVVMNAIDFAWPRIARCVRDGEPEPVRVRVDKTPKQSPFSNSGWSADDHWAQRADPPRWNIRHFACRAICSRDAIAWNRYTARAGLWREDQVRPDRGIDVHRACSMEHSVSGRGCAELGLLLVYSIGVSGDAIGCYQYLICSGVRRGKCESE